MIPLSLYMLFFVIHFAILQNSGDGDGFMSTEFKMSLRGRGGNQEPSPIGKLVQSVQVVQVIRFIHF